MITNPRESRLKHEFERMRDIQRSEGLIQFRCADLTQEEERDTLDPRTFLLSRQKAGLSGDYLTPEEFMERYPARAPEKYLVFFTCLGLKRMSDGQFTETREHLMEVIFGVDYPSAPPQFVWWTPIWHPNIFPPLICPDDRPFSVGTTLDQLCLMVGQMIQYRIYNVNDPMNREAAAWAAENSAQFPLERRDLLDGLTHEDSALTPTRTYESDGGAVCILLDQVETVPTTDHGTNPTESEPLVTLLP